MTCKEIMEALSELAPFEYAECWDNVGLLVGSPEKEVNTIFIGIDATKRVIEEAKSAEADMILTHHPLIFSPMKRIVDTDFVGKRVIELIKSDIAYVAMHTNFDIIGMADAAAERLKLNDAEVLEVTIHGDEGIDAGFGRVGFVDEAMSLSELGEYVKDEFNIPSVKIFGDPDTKIMKIAILPGSGKSAIDPAIMSGADVLITGDIGHHDGIDALERELCIIDAGHYGIEKLFISYMEEYLKGILPGIKVVTEKITEPFWVV